MREAKYLETGVAWVDWWVGSYTKEMLHPFTGQKCNYVGVPSCQRDYVTLIAN